MAILSCLSIAFSAQAESGPKPADQVMCEDLFKNYVLGGNMMTERSVRHGLQMLADIGRFNGFWQTVLSELRKKDSAPLVQRACAIVLGEILQEEKRMEELMKARGDRPQEQIPHRLCLSNRDKDEAVDSLLAALFRASHAKAREALVLALAKANDMRTSGALAGCIRSTIPVETQFYAAVGLSNLGDPRGFQFLVEHIESGRTVLNTDETPLSFWPENAVYLAPDGCCRAALQTLTGNKRQKSQSWRDWWAGKPSTQPVNLVFLRD